MIKKLLPISVFILCGFGLTAQTILGIDVSNYQGTITWSSVRKTSTKLFAWAKATEGTTITDAQFVNNEVNGVAAKVYMGAYHFSRPENNTATAEANYFVSVAGKYIKAGELPPALDLEDPPSGTALTSYFTSAALTSWVQTWMTTVQNATGVTPVLYTSGSIANYLGSSLHTYKLWTADPDGSPTATPSSTYLGGWSTWTFKQYSWTGAVSGISGNVDMDSFNGDTAAFFSLINASPPPPPVCKTFYTGLPYSMSFESTWIYDSCGQADQRLPDKYWKSSIGGTTPNGDDYWHRDDYTGSDWSTPTNGAYTPAASKGTYSARFHNDPPPAGSTGALDLYLNLSASGTKTISFDYIHNELSPSPFAFDVMLSTDGGSTFPTTLLSIPAQVAAWTSQSVTTTVTSATSVIRFIVTDKGTADVGIDNLNVTVGPTGISEIDPNSNFVVYPNPNNGTFTVSIGGSSTEKMQLSVYDALGQQVYNAMVNSGNTQVDIGNKATGVYFYRIMNESGDKLIGEGKLVVQH